MNIWLDHFYYPNLKIELENRKIITKHTIPVEVKELEDYVIIPVKLKENNFIFKDWRLWDSLKKEIHFKFVDTVKKLYFSNYVLNSPNGEYIVLETNPIEDLYLEILLKIKSNENTFKKTV